MKRKRYTHRITKRERAAVDVLYAPSNETLRRIYETECKLPGRNFAKEHSFGEWQDNNTVTQKALLPESPTK